MSISGIYWYSNARLAGKTCLLAGPFLTEAEALYALETVVPIACQLDTRMEHASFGSMSVKRNLGEGQYNSALTNKPSLQ